MLFTTAHQLNKFYDLYKNKSVTFTKDVMIAIGFKPSEVFVRCEGEQWPCIINSASMMEAQIICGKNTTFYEKLTNGSRSVSLRFTFADLGSKDPVSFFVSAKVIGMSGFSPENKDLMLVRLEYTQRAPDDLIGSLGMLFEANANFQKRSSERLELNDLSIHKIGLVKRETFIFVRGVPRRCILLNLSFSGVQLVMVGVANFVVNSDASIKLEFENPETTVNIHGKIVRAEHAENRKDLVNIAVEFDKDKIPSIFKMHLNKYFGQLRTAKKLDETDGNRKPTEE